MAGSIIAHIQRKTGIPNLVETLSEKLSPSEWHSLLMAVAQARAAKLEPADLLRYYRDQSFCQPSSLPMHRLLWLELQMLATAAQLKFQALSIAPVSPLGACSGIAKVSQNKILSAGGQYEVVADATNHLTLEAATRRKSAPEKTIRLCTHHRHLRTPQINIPGYTAHFKVFAAISAGRSQAGFGYVLAELERHLQCYFQFLNHPEIGFSSDDLRLTVFWNDAELKKRFSDRIKKSWNNLTCNWEQGIGNNYYDGIQFKLKIRKDQEWLEVADGGPVDWTQKLLSNKKERLIISGFGTELFIKKVL